MLVSVEVGLWLFNRWQARDAILYYEEQPYEVITRLGLMILPAEAASAKPLNQKVEPLNGTNTHAWNANISPPHPISIPGSLISDPDR